MVSKVRLVAVFYCIMPYPWGYHEEWKFIFKVMPQYDGNVARAYHECYEGGSQFPLPPSVSPISYRTLLRWWSNFEMHGETPTETAKREKLFLCRFKNKTFAQGCAQNPGRFFLPWQQSSRSCTWTSSSWSSRSTIGMSVPLRFGAHCMKQTGR